MFDDVWSVLVALGTWVRSGAHSLYRDGFNFQPSGKAPNTSGLSSVLHSAVRESVTFNMKV